jgi:hypothetical protein
VNGPLLSDISVASIVAQDLSASKSSTQVRQSLSSAFGLPASGRLLGLLPIGFPIQESRLLAVQRSRLPRALGLLLTLALHLHACTHTTSRSSGHTSLHTLLPREKRWGSIDAASR